MTPDTRIHRAASAAWRVIDGQVAIISTDCNRIRLLNAVGSLVWERCDGATVGDLIAAVRARYAVDEPTAARDVAHFIDDLAQRGMITVEGAP